MQPAPQEECHPDPPQQKMKNGIAKPGGDAARYNDILPALCEKPSWSQQKEDILLAPYEYLASKPGKEVRSQLILALNEWLDVPSADVQRISRIVSMLHNSSLLIDDVEDASELRRGHPSAHLRYGAPQTINSANYVYFLVFQEVFEMVKHSSESAHAVTRMLVDEMVNLHRGQGMDLYWRDGFVCPSEDEYVEMVNNKTGGLLRIVLKLMVGQSPKFSTVGSDLFLPLINLIGLLFQIRDDYMNLRSGDYANNKGYCEDLTEGKFSFPILHAVSYGDTLSSDTPVQQPSDTSLSNITNTHQLLMLLKAKPRDPDVKRSAVEYMQHTTHSFRYTCDVMLRLDRLVRRETARIEERIAEGHSNKRLAAILDALRKGWYAGPDCAPLNEV